MAIMNTNNGRELDIIVLGIPITKGSYQPYTKNGKAINVDPRLTVWESKIRSVALNELHKFSQTAYDCPVQIIGEIRVPRPSSAAHTFPAYQTAKDKGGGDLDKLMRAIGDALQAVQSRYLGKSKPGVLSNDSRIIGWNLTKLYETPKRPSGIYLTISPLESLDDVYAPWSPATSEGANHISRLNSIHTRINQIKRF